MAIAAAGVLLAAQPVYAAGYGIGVMNDAPVIVAGQGPSGNAQSSGSVAEVSPGGMEVSAPGGEAVNAPGSPYGGGTAVVPGNTQSEMPAVNVESSQQTPPGDEGTVLSPVLTAGGGGAAQQQAEAAAQQQAEAAAQAAQQQAAAEAAAQAAAQQAAAEAAAQAAAQQQAASQTSGRSIDPSRPMVALTFDDGPQPSVGNRIMDCLAQYGGKATFFMVGDRVAARKTEVQRMVAEGHEVANHTMNHKYLQKLGAAEINAQVHKANDAIEAACGVRPTIMRLPGGNHNSTVVANTHMPMIQWNIDTLDWKTKNADSTVAAVLNHVKDGDIVLMHELYSQSGDAALRIIPELHKRGFQMVTVSEMAAAKGKTLEAGKLYSEFR